MNLDNIFGRMTKKKSLSSILIGCSIKDQSRLTYMNSLLCLLSKVVFNLYIVFSHTRIWFVFHFISPNKLDHVGAVEGVNGAIVTYGQV